MRAPAVCLLVVMAACTAPNGEFNPETADLSSPPGPGPGIDGSGGGGGDGAVADSCPNIHTRVGTLLGNSVACKQDSDCTNAVTACGLPSACGDVYVNNGWLTTEMQGLIDQWKAEVCGPKVCPCPKVLQPAPACNAGQCGPKHVVMPPGPVGSPCTADSDCATLECLTQAQDSNFPGGYCTVKNCGMPIPCPDGSACRGIGNGQPICLDNCLLVAKTCRSGYQCCSGPGPTRDTGWCAPTKSGLCLAK